MTIQFERRIELAPGIWQYFFRPERQVDFVPGQYADFHILRPLDDPRGQSRTFTITSLPDDELISIVLKHFELQSSYKQALQALRSGDEMRLDDAMGDLILPKLVSQPLVFIAGGIGMASYASMFNQLIKAREERPIFFFYRLRNRREAIYLDLLKSYPLQSSQTILAPNQISADDIIAATPPEALVYLSGSQQFVEHLRADLELLGKSRADIVFDYYEGYSEL